MRVFSHLVRAWRPDGLPASTKKDGDMDIYTLAGLVIAASIVSAICTVICATFAVREVGKRYDRMRGMVEDSDD